MSKKSNDFENEFAEYLSKNGYWAYVCPKDKQGAQPADIIACNNHEHILVDCKLSEKPTFDFRRIEENQRTAMNMFIKKCAQSSDDACFFAIKYKGNVYKLYYIDAIEHEKNGKKSVKIEDLLRIY